MGMLHLCAACRYSEYNAPNSLRKESYDFMTLFPRRLRLMALGVAIVLAFIATLVWVAPGVSLQDTPRTGYDPLSPEEQERARTLAVERAEFASALNAAGRSELLLIERHAESKTDMRSGNWPRRADIYTYLYDSDTLLLAVVNLTSGQVDSVETSQNVQLPLTQNETDRAIQLLLADATLMANIAGQYQTITGAALTQPETQLKLNALIYRADAMPNANPGAAACGLHRCAQFLIATQNDVVINVLPIVDLSLGAVVSAGPFVN
jgi:Na+-transporting methylmalonyl-CoA/oxaloacetate decarboxylase gamma subunit